MNIEKIYSKFRNKVYKKYKNPLFFKALKKELDEEYYKFSFEFAHNPSKKNLEYREILKELIQMCVNNLWGLGGI